MKGSEFDKILRNKVSEKEYLYSDAYWQSAKQFIDEKRALNARRRFFYSFLAIVGIGSVSYTLWPQNSPEYLSENSINQSTIQNSNIHSVEQPSVSTAALGLTTQEKPVQKTKQLFVTPVTNAINSPPKKNETTELEQSSNFIAKQTTSTSSLSETSISNANVGVKSWIGSESSLQSNVENTITNSNTFLKNGNAIIPDIQSSKTRIPEALLSLSLLTWRPTENERNIYLNVPKSQFKRKKQITAGAYTQIYLKSNASDGEYKIQDDQLWSVGTVLEYPLTSGISIQGGIGYQHQKFTLSQSNQEIRSRVVIHIESKVNEQISSRQDWLYNMAFSGGVATQIDSSLTTLYDTTYTTIYDTNKTLIADTVKETLSSQFVLNAIELPLYIQYSKAFGRWEVFGGAGIHLNYLTSVKITSISDMQTAGSEQVKNFGMDASVRLGLSYIMSSKFKASLAPTYRMNALERYNFMNSKSNYTGITFSLLYRIR